MGQDLWQVVRPAGGAGHVLVSPGFCGVAWEMTTLKLATGLPAGPNPPPCPSFAAMAPVTCQALQEAADHMLGRVRAQAIRATEQANEQEEAGGEDAEEAQEMGFAARLAGAQGGVRPPQVLAAVDALGLGPAAHDRKLAVYGALNSPHAQLAYLIFVEQNTLIQDGPLWFQRAHMEQLYGLAHGCPTDALLTHAKMAERRAIFDAIRFGRRFVDADFISIHTPWHQVEALDAAELWPDLLGASDLRKARVADDRMTWDRGYLNPDAPEANRVERVARDWLRTTADLCRTANPVRTLLLWLKRQLTNPGHPANWLVQLILAKGVVLQAEREDALSMATQLAATADAQRGLKCRKCGGGGHHETTDKPQAEATKQSAQYLMSMGGCPPKLNAALRGSMSKVKANLGPLPTTAAAKGLQAQAKKQQRG